MYCSLCSKTRKMYKMPDMKNVAWLVALGLLFLAIGIQGCAGGEDDEGCEGDLLVCVRDIEPVTPVTVTPSCPGIHCPTNPPPTFITPPAFPTDPRPTFPTFPAFPTDPPPTFPTFPTAPPPTFR